MVALVLALGLQDAAAVDDAAAKIPGMEAARWKAVDDAAFLARVTRDLWGEDAADAKAFVDDPAPDKRARTVDALLDSPKFAAHWGRRMAVWLIGEPAEYRIGLDGVPRETERAIADAFAAWMVKGVRDDRPWTETVAALVESQGAAPDEAPLAWKLGFFPARNPSLETGLALAHRVMGLRLRCATCHDHTHDRWSVDDAYGLGAFFVRDVLRAAPDGTSVELKVKDEGEMFFRGGNGDARSIRPRFLFGGEARKNDHRLKVLAELVTSKANLQLGPAFANRVWAWLFGAGVVEPPDDFNIVNKPVSPALLGALSRAFGEGGHRLKPLLRAVLASRIYQCVDVTDPAKAGASSFRGHLVRDPRPAATPFGGFKVAVPAEWIPQPPERPGFRSPWRVPGKAGPGLFAGGPSSGLGVVRQVVGGPPPTVEKFDGPVLVTVTDVRGTYVCDPTSERPRENWRIVIATLRKDQKTGNLRLEGPVDTVAEWRDRFVELARKAETP